MTTADENLEREKERWENETLKEELEDAQKERIARLRERRDGAKTREALEKFAEAVEGDENLFEPTMEGVWDVYRARYGTFCEKGVRHLFRMSPEPLEKGGPCHAW